MHDESGVFKDFTTNLFYRPKRKYYENLQPKYTVYDVVHDVICLVQPKKCEISVNPVLGTIFGTEFGSEGGFQQVSICSVGSRFQIAEILVFRDEQGGKGTNDENLRLNYSGY